MTASQNHIESYQSLLLRIDKTYQLEKLDPKHRPVQTSSILFDKFNQTRAAANLQRVSLEQLINNENNIQATFTSFMSAETIPGEKKITYLDAKAAQSYRVKFINGLACDSQNHPLSTLHLKGKQNGYGAYVLDKYGQFYFAPHVKGAFHHASFTGGDDILCSGMIKITNGKVNTINNNSGHYKPGKKNLALAFHLLKNKQVLENKIDEPKRNFFIRAIFSILTALHLRQPTNLVSHTARNGIIIKIGHYLQQSNIRIFYWLGLLIDTFRINKTFSKETFSQKTASYSLESASFRAAIDVINKQNDLPAQNINEKNINHSLFAPPRPSFPTPSPIYPSFRKQ